MLIVGEVRTCLLHNSGRLPRHAVVELLEVKPGSRVLVTNRPVNRSISPDMLVGVDCRVPTEPLTKARGIGTVACHAVVTGGLVLQATARTHLKQVTDNQRQRQVWSHYARQRGVLEVISRASTEQLARGHRNAVPDRTALDLGAISEHLISVIQMRPQLDRRTVMRTRPTRLRWTAVGSDHEEPALWFHVDNEVLRTVELRLPTELLPLAQRFCEDLALHDWLITTLDSVIERAHKAIADATILTVAVSRLMHLWMPGAHVDPAMRGLWEGLEARPGFSRQWNAQVMWIRDQISLRMFDAVEQQARGHDAGW